MVTSTAPPGIAFALLPVQEGKGDDQHDGSYALTGSDLAPWPRRLRGMRRVLRAGRPDLPVLRQRRVRPASSSARGPYPQHDEQQLDCWFGAPGRGHSAANQPAIDRQSESRRNLPRTVPLDRPDEPELPRSESAPLPVRLSLLEER